MTLVYDKEGKEHKVPHKIDVQGWLDAGYTLNNLKEEKPKTTRNKKEEG